MVLFRLEVAAGMLSVQLDKLVVPAGGPDKEEGNVQVTVDAAEELGHCVCTAEGNAELDGGGVLAAFSFIACTRIISGLELALLHTAEVLSTSDNRFVLFILASLRGILVQALQMKNPLMADGWLLVIPTHIG